MIERQRQSELDILGGGHPGGDQRNDFGSRPDGRAGGSRGGGGTRFQGSMQPDDGFSSGGSSDGDSDSLRSSDTGSLLSRSNSLDHSRSLDSGLSGSSSHGIRDDDGSSSLSQSDGGNRSFSDSGGSDSF